MSFNALNLEWYLGRGSRFEAYEAGENTKPMVERLAAILDQLEPQGDDNLHTVWVKTGRPTFRQFYNFHYGYEVPYKEASPDEIEEARNYYIGSYPTPKVWVRLSVKHFTRKPGDEFYAVFIDNNYVFGINDYNSRQILEGTDLLEWAISEAENVVEKVREGTYQTVELEKVPYAYRIGTIKRSDLWDTYPESKTNFLTPFKKRALVKFKRYFYTGQPNHSPLPTMTARDFYEACAVIYKALRVRRKVRSYLFQENDPERERYGEVEQTPKEMYYANADGRDNGLKKVPLDDSDAFGEWLMKKGPYFEFNGSHPWEIIPSFSTSYSMHLVPWKKGSEGYIFSLSGESIPRMPDTILAANALYEAGYPFVIYDLEKIIDKLEGNDFVQVVPQSESDLFGESISLPEGKEGGVLAKKVTWMFDEYKTRSET